MRGSETIQIVPSGGHDSDGDPIPGGDPVVVKGCIIWPRYSTEDDSRGEIIIDGLNLYIPPGKPTPGVLDEVIARGGTYAVDGVPGEFVSPGGRDKGAMVALKKVGV